MVGCKRDRSKMSLVAAVSDARVRQIYRLLPSVAPVRDRVTICGFECLTRRKCCVKLDAVYHEDCVAGLGRVASGSIDLAFADPPFNIGYEYDVYEDRNAAEDYLDWCRQWIGQLHRVLKPDGTFWLAIGDEFA